MFIKVNCTFQIKLKISIQGNNLLIKVDRIRFDELFWADFQVIIDKNNTYQNIIGKYGTTPPNKLSVSYNILYNKYLRYFELIKVLLNTL